MNKRSAIAIAGGVTGALISGVAGYSIRIHQPLVAASADPSKPIVKTETRTITIHRKANPKKKDPALVVRRAPTLSAAGGYFLADRAPDGRKFRRERSARDRARRGRGRRL